MKEIVSLLQTALWIGLIIYLVKNMLPEPDSLKEIIAKRLESGSFFKLGPVEIGQLKAEVDIVRSKIIEVDKKIARLFLAAMAPTMYSNLEKLASGKFGEYKKTEGLRRELYHLRDIGYIKVESITRIPNDGPNLSDYVKITNTGNQFIELRKEIQKEVATHEGTE